MKKLLAVILAAMMLLSCASAMAELVGNDAEWRANLIGAAKGEYVEGLSQEEFDALTETTIIKDPDSITGYTVTFRHYAPDAKRVRIRGEWNFADARHSSPYTSSVNNPEDWTTDMFPLQYDGDWPAFDMVKNEATGVWSYTIPLPSGTWSYRFYEGGAEGAELTDYTDAVATTDVNNRPFEKELGEQGNSQVRVPFDPEKQVLDLSVQLPQPEGKFGTVEVLTYAADGVAEKKDDPAIAVYLPYGYDAKREEPYKVLYISHGMGLESETSWYNKGSLANITDNLIADGVIEPMVVVILNNYAVNFDVPSFMADVLPLVEKNYNVAKDPASRALCGLSRGGRFTTETMYNHMDAFDTYANFSGVNRDLEMPDNIDVRLYIAAGRQGFAFPGVTTYQSMLAEKNVAFESYFVDGGHDWNTWRQLYVDLLTNFLWK